MSNKFVFAKSGQEAKELLSLKKQNKPNDIKKFIKSINLPAEINGLKNLYSNGTMITHSRLERVGSYCKYNLSHTKTNYTVSVFKSTRNNDRGSGDDIKTTCVYSYLYSVSTKKDLIHRFITFSPTFTSMDGEFRHRFINYNSLLMAMNKFGWAFEIVEDFLVEQMESGKIELFAELFMSKFSLMEEDKILGAINDSRIAIKAWISCWLCDYTNFTEKINENHIHPGYFINFLDDSGIECYEKLVGEFEKRGQSLRSLTEMLSVAVPSDEINVSPIEIGQKIMPLTINESFTNNINNIRYNGWREIYICEKITNLLINFIAPCFQYTGNWIFIQNSGASLFDNKSMYDKHANGIVAGEIAKNLRDTNELTYIDRKRSRGNINKKFEEASYKISKTTHYVEDMLVLSDLSLMINVEYLGRTWRDTPYMAEQTKDPRIRELFSDNDMFMKVFFEFLYGFHCMNKRVGCFHGDFHLNNGTIYKTYTVPPNEKKYVYYFVNDGTISAEWEKSNYHILTGKAKGAEIKKGAYNRGAVECFIIPANGIQACIIDYSRSIIAAHDMIADDYTPAFADMFDKDQRDHYMRIINHYFPHLIERHKDRIFALIIENPALVFKILCAVDIFSAAKNTLQMLKTHPKLSNKRNDAFLIRLQMSSEKFITSNLEAAIERRISSVDDIDWPNLHFMREHFADWKFTGDEFFRAYNEHQPICDLFNFSNDILYKMNDETNISPIIDQSDILKEASKKGIELPNEWQMHFAVNGTEQNEIREITNVKRFSETMNVPKSSWMFA